MKKHIKKIIGTLSLTVVCSFASASNFVGVHGYYEIDVEKLNKCLEDTSDLPKEIEALKIDTKEYLEKAKNEESKKKLSKVFSELSFDPYDAKLLVNAVLGIYFFEKNKEGKFTRLFERKSQAMLSIDSLEVRQQIFKFLKEKEIIKTSIEKIYNKLTKVDIKKHVKAAFAFKNKSTTLVYGCGNFADLKQKNVQVEKLINSQEYIYSAGMCLVDHSQDITIDYSLAMNSDIVANFHDEAFWQAIPGNRIYKMIDHSTGQSSLSKEIFGIMAKKLKSDGYLVLELSENNILYDRIQKTRYAKDFPKVEELPEFAQQYFEFAFEKDAHRRHWKFYKAKQNEAFYNSKDVIDEADDEIYKEETIDESIKNIEESIEDIENSIIAAAKGKDLKEIKKFIIKEIKAFDSEKVDSLFNKHFGYVTKYGYHFTYEKIQKRYTDSVKKSMGIFEFTFSKDQENLKWVKKSISICTDYIRDSKDINNLLEEISKFFGNLGHCYRLHAYSFNKKIIARYEKLDEQYIDERIDKLIDEVDQQMKKDLLVRLKNKINEQN